MSGQQTARFKNDTTSNCAHDKGLLGLQLQFLFLLFSVDFFNSTSKRAYTFFYCPMLAHHLYNARHALKKQVIACKSGHLRLQRKHHAIIEL